MRFLEAEGAVWKGTTSRSNGRLRVELWSWGRWAGDISRIEGHTQRALTGSEVKILSDSLIRGLFIFM